MNLVLYDTETHLLKPYPRADELPVLGLDARYQALTVIQEAEPSAPAGTYLKDTEDIDLEAGTLTRGWSVESLPPPPAVNLVSMTALRLALIELELYAPVTAAISGMADATEKLKVQTWWETAQNVRRASPIVAEVAEALGKNEAEIDDVFTRAHQIQSEI